MSDQTIHQVLAIVEAASKQDDCSEAATLAQAALHAANAFDIACNHLSPSRQSVVVRLITNSAFPGDANQTLQFAKAAVDVANALRVAEEYL